VLASCVDRLYFGEWTFVPLNFLKLNVIKNIGVFYGSHPRHWYLTQGLPILFFTFLPIFPFGVRYSRSPALFFLALWVVSVYSLLGHKEFRFLFPLLPICCIYSGYLLYHLAPVIPFKSFRMFGTHEEIRRPRLKEGSHGLFPHLFLLLEAHQTLGS